MKKRCLHRGCPWYVTSGSYCQEHKPYRRGWQQLSAEILRRDDYRCGCHGCSSCDLKTSNIACGRQATTVDHINGDALDNYPDNLRAMCRPCNTAKGGLA